MHHSSNGNRGDTPSPSPPEPSPSIQDIGIAVDKQTEKIQIVNACKNPLWVAYLSNVPQNIKTGGEGGV